MSAGDEARGKKRGWRRISPLLVDCQNSRSLCRFYSRSLSVVTSVKSKLFRIFSGERTSPAISSLLLYSLEKRIFFFRKVTRFARVFFASERLPRPSAATGGNSRPETHGAQTTPRRKTFTPRGAHVVALGNARASVCACVHVQARPRTRHRSALRLPAFPDAGGKIRRDPVRRKDAGFGFWTGGSGYTRARAHIHVAR